MIVRILHNKKPVGVLTDDLVNQILTLVVGFVKEHVINLLAVVVRALLLDDQTHLKINERQNTSSSE